MPAPIVGGLIAYLAPELAILYGTAAFSVWDGETPRYDVNGQAVGPANTTGSWPALDLSQQEPGFHRTPTVGTNAAKDLGTIVTRCWGTSREQVEEMMNHLELVLSKEISVYQNVDVGGPSNNPNYVYKMTLETWGCWVDSNYRTANSSLLYRGEMTWDCRIHTNAPSMS